MSLWRASVGSDRNQPKTWQRVELTRAKSQLEKKEDKEDDKVAVLAQDFGIEAAAEAVAIVLAAREDAARPTVAVDELTTGPLAELARL